MDFFTTGGIIAWQSRLNSSPTFASAAASWAGRLLLIERADAGDDRSTWVVVKDGCCMEARVGTSVDEANADFVLAASASTWGELVAAGITPATAALTGKLKLLKGDVMSLIPHAKAAAELLAAAGESPPPQG